MMNNSRHRRYRPLRYDERSDNPWRNYVHGSNRGYTMFFVFKLLLWSVVLVSTSYAVFFVDLGGNTLAGHVSDIWQAPITQRKLKAVKSSIYDRMLTELAAKGRDPKASKGNSGRRSSLDTQQLKRADVPAAGDLSPEKPGLAPGNERQAPDNGKARIYNSRTEDHQALEQVLSLRRRLLERTNNEGQLKTKNTSSLAVPAANQTLVARSERDLSEDDRRSLDTLLSDIDVDLATNTDKYLPALPGAQPPKEGSPVR